MGCCQSEVEISSIQLAVIYLVRIIIYIYHSIIILFIFISYSANCNKVGHFTQDCTVGSSSQVPQC